MNWPATKDGQKNFLAELVAAVRSAPKGLGRGVIWWYPESIRTEGVNGWKGGDVALFDDAGDVLPAMTVFGYVAPEGAR